MGAEAAPRDGDLIGVLIADRYRISEPLDRGGMADVYRARDTSHGRDVAVKFLREDISSVIGSERFRREISIAATLSHPHIVPLFDSGEWNRRLYYVMPFVQGRNLRQVLDRDGPLPVPRAVSIARDVGEALAYAHARGIVHRDIKPSNIILTDQYALVTDFGVAKALGGQPIDDITGAGMALGTPRYMAPEQASDPGRVTPRSDTYSFGCVVYEMLTGSPPFQGAHLPGLIADHLLKDAPSLDTLDPTIPHDIAQAVQRAIAKHPDQRFDTVTEFVESLERGATGQTVRRAIPGARPTSNRLWWAAAIAVSIAMITLVWRAVPAEGWVDGRPSSVLVVALENATGSPEEQELAVELADALTFELSWWDEVRPVPQGVQSGAMHDLGIDGPAVSGISEAVELAERLRAAGAVLVRVRARPEDGTARVEYSVVRTAGGWFGRGRGRAVGSPTVVEAGMDPAPLIEPIARRLLGLEETAGEVFGQRAGTRSRVALQEYDAAQRALASWRLAEAEERFGTAIAEDSTFAMAHLGLAQTLYWQLDQDPGGMAADLGPRVLQASAAARRHARDQDLPARLLDHVEGFYAFATGDYAAARDLYGTIVERDPNDVAGHLLRGSVEYADPWVTEEPTRGPRSDLDRAIASFDRAVELDPDFELGYGHLFDIHRLVRAAADSRGCLGFETPREALISPWAARSPASQEIFCLVPGDSLRWVPGDRGDEVDPGAALAAAAALEERSFARLQRWTEFNPDSPRPLEELARARREAYERTPEAGPSALATAAEAAAVPQRRALALRPDTLPGDLFALANLEGAAGRLDVATVLIEDGLDRHRAETPDRAVPSLAANPLLAAGRLGEVFGILTNPQRSAAIRGPEGELIEVPAEAVLGAQHVLAAGVLLAPEDSLRTLLARVEGTWSGPGTTAAESAALRNFLGARMLPALAPHRDLVLEWTDATSDDPLVRLVRAVAEGRPDVREVLLDVVDDPSVRATAARAFVVGRVAATLEEPEVAERFLVALDSIPLPLRQFSSAWGLRTGAAVLRAELRLGLGDPTGAREAIDLYRTLVPPGADVASFLESRAAQITADGDTVG